MDYYASMTTCLLNSIIMLEHSMIDCLLGEQVLSAVGDGRMTVVVCIINIAVLTWVVVLFGMRLFHIHERWGMDSSDHCRLRFGQ